MDYILNCTTAFCDCCLLLRKGVLEKQWFDITEEHDLGVYCSKKNNYEVTDKKSEIMFVRIYINLQTNLQRNLYFQSISDAHHNEKIRLGLLSALWTFDQTLLGAIVTSGSCNFGLLMGNLIMILTIAVYYYM